MTFDTEYARGHERIREIIESAKAPDFRTSSEPQLTHRPIQWRALIGDPPEREWIWDSLIPKGQLSSLYGDGGTGKSLLAQQLATLVALGHQHAETGVPRELFGKQLAAGPVLVLLSEDNEDEIWRRQADINRAFACTMNDLDDLHVISGFGRDNLLMEFDKKAGILRPLHEHLLALAKRIKPALVIIDNAADTFGGEENQRCAVTQFLKVALGGIAFQAETSVLLIGHPSVHGKESGSGLAGSTAWNNSVRGRLYLSRMNENDEGYDANVRHLNLMKANYAPSGAKIALRYSDGVFREADKPAGPGAALDHAAKKALVLREIRWLNEQGENISPNTRAGNCAEKRLVKCEPIRRASIRRPEVARLLDSLMRDKKIEIVEYRNNGKQAQRYQIVGEPHD